MILIDLPTGTIDTELIDGQVRIQFNCACVDALPYCQAACCRSRPDFNVHLTMAEASLPLVVAVDTPYGARFAFDWVDGHCRHLDAQCRCRIHDQKPAACRTFHCSPRGGDGTETVRGTGFALTPVLPKV